MRKDEFDILSDYIDETNLAYEIDYDHIALYLKRGDKLYHLDDIIGATNLDDLKTGDLIINPYQDKSYLKVIAVDKGNDRALLELS